MSRALPPSPAGAASRQQAESADANAFVQAYLQDIYRLTLSILDDAAEADEATQDTFVAAWKAMDSYRGEASQKTWLFSIAINICRKRLRQRKTREGIIGTLQSLFRISGVGPTHLEDIIIRREARTTLWKTVDGLSEKLRLPLLLHYEHDLSVAEIAETLGIPQGTVLSRLYNARERLRIALQDNPDIAPEAEGFGHE